MYRSSPIGLATRIPPAGGPNRVRRGPQQRRPIGAALLEDRADLARRPPTAISAVKGLCPRVQEPFLFTTK